MADVADVEQAIASMLAGALYPNGTSQPSIVGATVTLQRGWPNEAQVQKAVGVQSVLISVHGNKGMARDSTRYFRDWIGQAGTPTITATVSGFTVIFGGTVSAGHAIAVQSAGVWFKYLVVGNDTATTIAAAFAAQIPGASSSGPILTLPAGGRTPQARVVLGGNVSANVSRQTMVFQICCWAPTPALRDAVFSQLPPIVAYLGSRLPLPDGTFATWMGQRETGPDDLPGRAEEWRRDVMASYEFGVNYTQAAQALLLLEIAVSANEATLFNSGDTVYPGDVLTDGNGNPLLDETNGLLGQV